MDARRRFIPALPPSYVFRGMWHLLPLVSEDIKQAFAKHELVLPQIVSRIDFGPQLALDIETTAKDEIELVGLTTDGVHVMQLDPPVIGDTMLYTDAAEHVLAHNAKFDITHLDGYGVVVEPSKIVDTMIAQAFSQPDMDVGLGAASSITLTGRQTWWKGLWGFRWKEAEVETVRNVWREIIGLDEPMVGWYRWYNALDVAMTWRLGNVLRAELSCELVGLTGETR